MTLQSSVTLGLFRLTSKPQLCEKRTSTERPSVQQLLEQRLPRMYSVYAANSTWCFQAVASAWASKRGSPPDAAPVMLWAPLSISFVVLPLPQGATGMAWLLASCVTALAAASCAQQQGKGSGCVALRRRHWGCTTVQEQGPAGRPSAGWLCLGCASMWCGCGAFGNVPWESVLVSNQHSVIADRKITTQPTCPFVSVREGAFHV